jgi:Polyketide cyclase / dehydrase and lipid transport
MKSTGAKALMFAFSIERETSIAAPAETVFAMLNDFRRWGSWSPFESGDRAASRCFRGAPNAKGAVYAWSGASRAGVTRARLLDSTPQARVTIELGFANGCDTSEFTLHPAGDTTNVTWSLHGLHPFLGGLLESGLASLKAAAEGVTN